MRDKPVTASFSIDGMVGAVTIDVLDENRTITATDGTFHDDFDGYGVHLYKISRSSGVVSSGGRMNMSMRSSLRLVPVIENGNNLNSLIPHADAPAMVYTIKGTLLKKLHASFKEKRRISAGAYIISTKR